MRQNKRDYFELLDIKYAIDNKMFWKSVAPLFSNKSKASNEITLSKNEKLITNDQKCAEVFNNYFNSIVEELNILIDQNLLNDASLFDDPIIAAVHKHKRHPGILRIKGRIIKENKFTFSKILSKMFNFYIDTFPNVNGLKKVGIKPVYKKDDPFDKTNYRTISTFPVLSKAF